MAARGVTVLGAGLAGCEVHFGERSFLFHSKNTPL